MQKLMDLIIKYKSIILYIIFGAATTVIDFTIYFSFTRLLGVNEQIAQWIAWFFAVVFAFFTNRKWVFEAGSKTTKNFIWQVLSFFGSRLFSGFINWLMILIFVTIMGISDIIIKCVAAVFIVILNYVLSKLIVFRKKEQVSK